MPHPLPAAPSKVPKAFLPLGAPLASLIRWAGQWEALKVGTGLSLQRAKEGHRLVLVPEQVVAMLSGSSLSGGGGNSGEHPFRVYPSNLTDPASPKARLVAASYVWSSLTSSGTTNTITDLGTEITLAASMRVYLRLTVNSTPAVTARAIVTATSSFPANVVIASGAQTQANLLIGRVVSGALGDKAGFDFSISGTAYHFEQTLFNHVIETNLCVSGVPSIMPVPHAGS